MNTLTDRDGQIWTKEEVTTLQYLYKGGYTLKQISVLIGRPHKQCRVKLATDIELERRLAELKALDDVLEMLDSTIVLDVTPTYALP